MAAATASLPPVVAPKKKGSACAEEGAAGVTAAAATSPATVAPKQKGRTRTKEPASGAAATTAALAAKHTRKQNGSRATKGAAAGTAGTAAAAAASAGKVAPEDSTGAEGSASRAAAATVKLPQGAKLAATATQGELQAGQEKPRSEQTVAERLLIRRRLQLEKDQRRAEIYEHNRMMRAWGDAQIEQVVKQETRAGAASRGQHLGRGRTEGGRVVALLLLCCQ